MGEENHRNLRESNFLFIWNPNVSIKVLLLPLDFTFSQLLIISPAWQCSNTHQVSIPILESFLFSMRFCYNGEEKHFEHLVILQIKKIPSCFMSGRTSEALSPTELSLFFCQSPQKNAQFPNGSSIGDKQHLPWLVHVNAWAEWPALCNQRKCTNGK